MRTPDCWWMGGWPVCNTGQRAPSPRRPAWTVRPGESWRAVRFPGGPAHWVVGGKVLEPVTRRGALLGVDTLQSSSWPCDWAAAVSAMFRADLPGSGVLGAVPRGQSGSEEGPTRNQAAWQKGCPCGLLVAELSPRRQPNHRSLCVVLVHGQSLESKPGGGMVPCRTVPAPWNRLPLGAGRAQRLLKDRDHGRARSRLPAPSAADGQRLGPRGWASLRRALRHGQRSVLMRVLQVFASESELLIALHLKHKPHAFPQTVLSR